MKSLQMRKTSQ
jgi:hypothetical protein